MSGLHPNRNPLTYARLCRPWHPSRQYETYLHCSWWKQLNLRAATKKGVVYRPLPKLRRRTLEPSCIHGIKLRWPTPIRIEHNFAPIWRETWWKHLCLHWWSSVWSNVSANQTHKYRYYPSLTIEKISLRPSGENRGAIVILGKLPSSSRRPVSMSSKLNLRASGFPRQISDSLRRWWKSRGQHQIRTRQQILWICPVPHP